MEVKASLKNLRSSRKKAQLVVDVVRDLDVDVAQTKLILLNKQLAKVVLKLINSAIANAENNLGLKKDNLHIKEIIVGEGPTMKRWRPRAFGRAGMIRKRTSMIKLTLEEKVPTDPKDIKKTKIESKSVKAGEDTKITNTDRKTNTGTATFNDKSSQSQNNMNAKRKVFQRKSG